MLACVSFASVSKLLCDASYTFKHVVHSRHKDISLIKVCVITYARYNIE